MSLRRPRSHRVGISNIDFRTKRDIENINIPDSTTKTKFNREKINKIFQALFTIMKYYYVQSEDNRKEKFIIESPLSINELIFTNCVS